MTLTYGERIKQAREFKGLTQTQLANLIGVKQAAISQLERNEFMPSSEVLEAIAEHTGFLPPFFEVPPDISLPLGTLNYRARKSLTAREETQAYQYANVLYQQIKRIAPDLSVPSMNLPRLPNVSTRKAAQVTRDALGFSVDEPIRKLLKGIESGGVFIFTLPSPIPDIDAFSTWAQLDELRPIIVMMSGKPMDRLRFSIAHELGHLVMHGAMSGRRRLLENEANEFASDFLTPERAMRNEMTSPVTLTSLARLKVRWGVSIQALIMRAKSLKIITDRQAKYLFTQMSVQGWRTREPSNLDIGAELPSMVRRMIETKYKTLDEYALKAGMKKETAMQLYVHA